ncbi:MAG TPA: P63C domain-containing protein [Vicinamibacterales bacterium]|nr:P63C domain-containing protein [Vicinamibacterales bacterium]
MAKRISDKSAADFGAEGGKARARNLSPDQRRDIARQAADARWMAAGKTKILRATHEGPLNIAGLILPSAVLGDGTRVISQRAFTGALGAPQGGHAFAKRAAQGVADLPIFLADEMLTGFISIDLAASLSSPVEYVPVHGGRSAFGIRADLVPAVCDVWLKAREAGALKRKHQLRVAHRAEILMRGLAHVGIIALVDEATGYQDVRSRDALAKILEAFVTKELQPWVRAFPPDFYKEMFRLKRVPYTSDLKRPKYFGHLTNNLVYKRLAPGVLAELRAKNPVVVSGRRKHAHHQYLTPVVGHPKLLHHLGKVTALMAISADWSQFQELVDKHLPVHKHYPLFDGAIDPTEQ